MPTLRFSHFIINNILEGLIWFWVPASLVICNDVFAYIWGITLGRTPLIKLSPKKTVEGFIGAFFSTVIFAYLWGTYFMQFNYMICPVHDLGVSAFSPIQCTPNPIFVWKDWPLWKPLSIFLSTMVGPLIPNRDCIVHKRWLAWASSDNLPLRTLSITSAIDGLFHFPCGSIRRFLRLWVQTCLQHQGFRPQYPRSRWYDGPYGLPVRDYIAANMSHNDPSFLPGS